MTSKHRVCLFVFVTFLNILYMLMKSNLFQFLLVLVWSLAVVSAILTFWMIDQVRLTEQLMSNVLFRKVILAGLQKNTIVNWSVTPCLFNEMCVCLHD